MRTIQHFTEPMQAQNAPPANACPHPDSGALGMTEEHLSFAA
jgi:hypothetical protein